MSNVPNIKPGVVTGKALQEIFDYAKAEKFAIPAVNVIGSSSINAALQAAKEAKTVVMIQFSNGGGVFNAGKALDNTDQKAAIAGSIAGAKHIREMAKHYGVPVILHTDHCAHKLLPWIDGLLDAGEAYHKEHGRPLFSSHMLDLSEEPLDDNISISKQYYKRMHDLGMSIEIELGVTGGEEDGVDNTDVDASKLYTQPEEVAFAYEKLNEVSPRFTIAAAFGNVHGVYKPGNVELKPIILKNSQEHVQEKFNTEPQPLRYVFHGGSGSSREDILEAIGYGVIKMNIDTDMQWAFASGVRDYFDTNKDYLKTQIGNPEGDEVPNKKYYDPRKWLRFAEQSFVDRLKLAFEDLNCLNRNA